MNKSTKATRIRKMLAKGAPVKTIVKSTGSTPAYVYSISSMMKKEVQENKAKTGITPLLNLDEVSAQHKKDIEAHIAVLNKHNKPTLWQRFKAAIGL